MANLTIGFVDCPIMGDKAEVRRDKRRKLYYVGLAGKITPNLIGGQKWLDSVTEFINGNNIPLPTIKIDNEPVNEKTEPEIKGITPVNEKTPVKAKKSLMDILFKEE
jgi:hypothetical protein